MPIFYIENGPLNGNYRRIAIVYAENKEEAEKKLLERFPDSTGLRYIDKITNINVDLNTCIIR